MRSEWTRTIDNRQRKRTRRLAAGIAAACAIGAFPAGASAEDYCVAPNDDCEGLKVDTLEVALDLADQLPEADRIFLGAGTYTAPSTDGYSYNQSDWPVEIIGRGIGQTVLTGPPDVNVVLHLNAGDPSSVHDLTIDVPDKAALLARGLVTNSVARRIEVIEHQTQPSAMRGVELHDGGILDDSTVTIDSDGSTIAVALDERGGSVHHSTLSARSAVVSAQGGGVFRSRLTGTMGVTQLGGVLDVQGSLIRFDQTGISVGSLSGQDTALNADGVTLAGDNYGSTGARVSTALHPDGNAALRLANSIIRGANTSLKVEAPDQGQATVVASYSDANWANGDVSGPGADVKTSNVSNVMDAVGFADAAAGDFRLLPDSPLVDAGDPFAPDGLDLDGMPLVVDGNGDGIARRDLGAFELPPATHLGGDPVGDGAGAGQLGGGQQGGTGPSDTAAPVVGAFRASPSVFAIARARTPLAARVPRGTRFRYTLSEQGGVTVKIQRVLRGGGYRTLGRLTRKAASGANSIRFTGRLGKRALRPGRYRVVLTGVDLAGHRSAPRRTRFRIVRP